MGSKKQPSAQSFLKLVTNVAQGRLCILNKKRVNIIKQMLPHQWGFFHNTPNIAGVDSQGFARHLHQASIGRTHSAQHCRHTYKAEATNYCDLNRPVAAGPRK